MIGTANRTPTRPDLRAPVNRLVHASAAPRFIAGMGQIPEILALAGRDLPIRYITSLGVTLDISVDALGGRCLSCWTPGRGLL